MRRKFAFNLLILLTANLLVKPFWIFGIDRVVQNRLGPEAYGTYFAVFNYSFIFSIILDFGINNFNNRAVSRNNRRMGEYLLNLLLLKFVLGIFYFVFTFLTAQGAGFSALQLKMLLFLALNQILLSAVLYFRSNIAALQLFKTDSFISILDRLLTIVFCLVLMYGASFKNDFNILWFIYAQTFALLLTAFIAFVIVAGKTVVKIKLWHIRYSRMILLKSAPFALLTLLMGIYYRIDGVMLERMLHDNALEAGIYAAAYRLLDALNQFGYLFATLLLPLFASMIRKNESVKQLVKFSSELMLAGSVAVGVGCYFYRAEIMNLLYHRQDAYWSTIFGWLMLNFIPMSSVYIFGTLLTAKGSLRALNIIAVLGVLINVGLNIYMIPHYGALGATYATLITQVIAAAAHVFVAQREFPLEYNGRDILKVGGFMVMACLLLWASHFSPLQWWLNLGLSFALCGGAAFALGIVPLEQLSSLLKRGADARG